MSQLFLKLLALLAIDVLWLAVLAVVCLPFLARKSATYAVLRRNFVGYFSNPTGYVFLCLFVLLTSSFAFWPHEFFNANLATLDQLNKVLPLIMLFFVPTITMSVWADERRQGTDELLLTIPAADFDVVLGKYLAAASIFTASLLFSQVSNFVVLLSLSLGDLDTGLFFSTYLGYWMIGLAMLALGMVASFLTSNLTVSFILGVLFNAPFVFAAYADVLTPSTLAALAVSRWSAAGQFDAFSRGIISPASIAYFLMIVTLGVYLSMVLIGRRHWVSTGRGFQWGVVQFVLVLGALASFLFALGVEWGSASFGIAALLALALLALGWFAIAFAQKSQGLRDADLLLGHYVARVAAVLLVLLGGTLLLAKYDWFRLDTTEGQVASLAPETLTLLGSLSAERPVLIEAYVSDEVPEEWVKTKLALSSLLKEFEHRSPHVKVRLHNNLTLNSDQAAEAQEHYGIRSERKRIMSRGQYRDEDVLMGAAFTSGLERVVIPFFEYGRSVEYELARAIHTVSREERKKLGVVRTDAQVMGGMNMPSMGMGMPQRIPKQPVLEELEGLHTLEEVDPGSPIDVSKYDALLVVQPSSLSQPQLDHLVAALNQGIPAAIFEDPFPNPGWGWGAGGTGAPKRSANPFGGGGEPKCNIQGLWDAIGIEKMIQAENPPPTNPMAGFAAGVVWQDYNPYPKVQVEGFSREFVFASSRAPGAEDTFAIHPITNGLQEVLFAFPGALEKKGKSSLEFVPLVTTSPRSGVIQVENLQDQNRPREATDKRFVLAAHIHGKAGDDSSAGNEKGGKDAKHDHDHDHDHADHKHDHDHDHAHDEKGEATGGGKGRHHQPGHVNVVYVADIDVMGGVFVQLWNAPNEEVARWQMENVSFVMNVIDYTLGSEELLAIRKRRARYPSLKMIDQTTELARSKAAEKEREFVKEMEGAEDALKSERDKAVDDIRKRLADIEKEPQKTQELFGEMEKLQFLLGVKQTEAERRYREATEKNARKLEADRRRTERERDSEIQRIQNMYKAYAVIIPPIPPFLVGLMVFARRRLREREGMSRARLR